MYKTNTKFVCFSNFGRIEVEGVSGCEREDAEKCVPLSEDLAA